MFIEFHLKDSNEKILVNLNKINAIYQQGSLTMIYAGEVVYSIKETYSEVVDAINNYYNLSRA